MHYPQPIAFGNTTWDILLDKKIKETVGAAFSLEWVSSKQKYCLSLISQTGKKLNSVDLDLSTGIWTSAELDIENKQLIFKNNQGAEISCDISSLIDVINQKSTVIGKVDGTAIQEISYLIIDGIEYKLADHGKTYVSGFGININKDTNEISINSDKIATKADISKVNDKIALKQDLLIPGSNITLNNNIINATLSNLTLGRDIETDIAVGHIPAGTILSADTKVIDLLYEIFKGVTPPPPTTIYDYYIGCTTGSTTTFKNKTKNELLDGIFNTGIFESDFVETVTAWGEKDKFSIYYILIKEDYNNRITAKLKSTISEGQSLETNWSNQDIKNTAKWKATHDSIKINNINYYVYGYRTMFNTNDAIIIYK